MPMAKRRHTLASVAAPLSLSPGVDPALGGVRRPILRRLSSALTAVARRPVSFCESVLRGSDGTCGCTSATCWTVTEGRRAGLVSIQRVDRAGDDVFDGYVPGVVSAACPCPQCSQGPRERAYRAAVDSTLQLSAAHCTLSPCAGGQTAERYTAQACRPTVRQARRAQQRNWRPFSPHAPTRGRRWALIPIVSHDRRVSPQLRIP